MTGVSSSIGLISGIDTASLISQLLAVEARPKILAQSRQAQLQAQQSAFLGINSLLLALQSAAAKFSTDKIFDSKSATSSSDSILTATAGPTAQPGTYQFIVDRLVTSNQHLSQGFANADSTELGLSQISFEYGHGRLTTDSALVDLNGGSGVARGKIKITDRTGASSIIDLSKAVTVNDVLDAINGNSGIGVVASVSSDGTGLTITDTSGGGGSLVVANDTGYTTATDLGIAGSDAGGTIVGSQINEIGLGMSLGALNDGNGVRINRGLDLIDFTIQTADGSSFDIQLGSITVGPDTEPKAATLQEVKDRIETQTSGAVTMTIGADGQSITLTDNTSGGSTFQVGAGTAGATAAAVDLGIFKSADVGTPTIIDGDKIFAGLNSVLTRSLNGGAGLSGATTLAITDRSGALDTFTIDENTSISDIIEQINASGTIDVTASLNKAGNGLRITDNTGGGNNLIVDGNAATALGISTGATGIAANMVEGTNVQLQYVSGATKISDLNYGRGVAKGSFRIIDGLGGSANVDIGSDSTTLQDIIDEINSKGLDILARVNDTGDGLIIENTAASPVVAIKVESVSGTTAKDLNILGTAADVDTNNFIDGSYEQKVDVQSTDTLNDLIKKINDAGINAVASLVNSGSGNTPYYLNLTSRISGTAGDLLIDTGGVDLGLHELVKAQDAVVFFGSSDPASAILVTSTTNTLDKVVNGVKIDLRSASSTPVDLVVANDNEAKITAVKAFVDAFNAVLTRLANVSKYDPETQQKGPLLGNATVARIRSQLYRTIQGKPKGVETQFQYLTSVGLTIRDNGNLVLNEDKLRQALNDDPEAVKNLFAAKELADDQNIPIGNTGVTYQSSQPIYDSLGVAEQINVLAKSLTNTVDGTLTLVNKNYDSLIQIQIKRIADFDKQLESRRTILERQFAAMEQSLAALQSQQSALAGLVRQ